MIIIKNTAIIKELRNFLSFLKLSFKQYFYFFYLNLVRSLRENNKSKIKSNSIIFSTSNTQYRSWHSYQKLYSLPSKKITYIFDKKGEFIKYVRIIIPEGLRALKNLKINIKEFKQSSNKSELISKEYFLSTKQLDYFRNLNKLDIKLDSNIKELSIQNDRKKIGVQIFKSISEKQINTSNTIYAVLDAVSYQSFLRSYPFQGQSQ